MKVGAQTIGFPSISTGIFGYPVDKATQVAVQTILGFDSELSVRLVAFGRADFATVEAVLRSQVEATENG